MKISADKLTSLVAEIFAAAGCSPAEAARIGDYLVRANLTGHDSHGVIRVPRYLIWLEDGTLQAGQSVEVLTESDSMALLDGKHGFGQSLGPEAVALGIDKAQKTGIAIVALRRAGHLGRIGEWAEMACEAGLVSMHLVNVSGSVMVAPFGGTERRMATNPLTIGVPRPDAPPLILDFATSMVAEGKLLVAMNGGKAMSEPVLIDADGSLSGDPRVFYGDGEVAKATQSRHGSGAIRAMGEHKGSGLSFMIELLAGALTGSGCCGPGPRKVSNGMLSVYLRPGAFDESGGSDAAAFAAEVESYVDFFTGARPATPDGEVLVPGQPEQRDPRDPSGGRHSSDRCDGDGSTRSGRQSRLTGKPRRRASDANSLSAQPKPF